MPNRAEAYRRHAPEVLAYLRRRLWSREEAEDLCQESFLRALSSGTALAEVHNPRAYLLRIAHNLMVSHLRRRRVRGAEGGPSPATSPEGLADRGRSGPDEMAEQADFARRLKRNLAGLRHEYRTAFELGVLERRPYAEVARALNCSEGSVKAYVHRARKELMRALRDYGPGGRGGEITR